MRIEYSEQFLKDLKRLKNTASYTQIKRLCFEELPEYEALSMVNHLKMIRGYKHYYRIREGDYRIGIKNDDGIIVFMRVLHRKDIYRVFPATQG
ncbi:MAG: type II toxin-antitoxin system RelE/ParE family toxin [Deltaproteobacteria bacterium]|jgi:mRNA interferase RelE/StbE